MSPRMLLVLLLACAGCTETGKFSWSSNKSVNGNNTGGIVPETVTDENEQNELARAHCAQYGKVMRVTALPKDTAGRLIFVCDPPGTQPPPGASATTPAGSGNLPPGVRLKKQP